ncbi:MAG: zinc finger Ran-binding domain-containing protein [Vulcanimicrobiota bacterium]
MADLGGAFLRECPSCHFSNPISALRCQQCQAALGEPEPVSLDYTAHDHTNLDEDYTPLHQSPNLLALREAVDELRAGQLDSSDYTEVVSEVRDSVRPALAQLEQAAAQIPINLPESVKASLKAALDHNRAYLEALELMLDQPEAGLAAAQAALEGLDRLEREAAQAAAELGP